MWAEATCGHGARHRPQPIGFLFDVSLSNLDPKLRVQMRSEIKILHHRVKTTSVYVTHDQIEAMTLRKPKSLPSRALISRRLPCARGSLYHRLPLAEITCPGYPNIMTHSLPQVRTFWISWKGLRRLNLFLIKTSWRFFHTLDKNSEGRKKRFCIGYYQSHRFWWCQKTSGIYPKCDGRPVYL